MCKYIDELKKCGFKKKCIKDIAKKYDLKESELKIQLFFNNFS